MKYGHFILWIISDIYLYNVYMYIYIYVCIIKYTSTTNLHKNCIE